MKPSCRWLIFPRSGYPRPAYRTSSQQQRLRGRIQAVMSLARYFPGPDARALLTELARSSGDAVAGFEPSRCSPTISPIRIPAPCSQNSLAAATTPGSGVKPSGRSPTISPIRIPAPCSLNSLAAATTPGSGVKPSCRRSLSISPIRIPAPCSQNSLAAAATPWPGFEPSRCSPTISPIRGYPRPAHRTRWQQRRLRGRDSSRRVARRQFPRSGYPRPAHRTRSQQRQPPGPE